MAGRVQLETSGPQDAFFTDDPEYTYFIKNFQKHTNFAPFFVDLDVEGEVEFGNTIRCTIPQNQGDLLKTVSMKVELSSIQQNLVNNIEGIGYVESIGHAMIEYVEIMIGGQVIQRIPSDFLAIYSDNYVTQTKQHNLEKLIGKPPLEFSGTQVSSVQIAGYLGLATSDTKYFVDIPFYFYNNPELAVPLCAITGQEIEIVIKLRDLKDCVWGYDATDPANSNSIFYLGDFVQTKGLIKSLKLTTEMVSLDEEEKQMLLSKKIDYIITQIQESKSIIPQDSNVNSIVDVKHKLKFKNPIKELFFIVQRLRKLTGGHFVTNFDYDSNYQLYNGEYVNYEHLQNLEIQLDDSVILDKVTGNVINLRAIQSGIHHSRTQLFRRYYSYSFALEPERWYPTGQRNFSLIKEQDIKLKILPDNLAKRELRVLGLSYNILRVENGIAKTLFNL
ncbi:hypothetical protein BpV1_081 [Bathycoccus sp. RCC1105 virus BpV1]|uniref:hypothetical protein n=1 Tax=Bathycoccus sp. RCC1105 virus BpV1 TaxID=880159 RepID=UPI0001EF43D2|nr:hypothetical protein BpV1_081 [Bathycoccus sp. RCC1105 virus BpV1]ADQ91708.1 hypothetical protein BpV1_081 [Bathycoccus sp. RCC1105 virus BpV1]